MIHYQTHSSNAISIMIPTYVQYFMGVNKLYKCMHRLVYVGVCVSVCVSV
jgi:hypothetical protein